MSASVTSLYPRRWWALAVLVAGQFMFVADAFIVNVAIPSIKADLGASSSEIEAVVAIYQIAYAALLITGGRLGDIHGRKRWFIIGVLGFTAASAWCAIAGSPLMLIAARGAQGITAAFMVPQVLASIQTMFPSEERTRAFGVVGLALGLGGAAGLMLGGWLISLDVHGLGWRSAFIINIPVGLLVAASALPLVPEPQTASRTRLDVPGVLVLAIGLALVLGPELFGRDMAWPWWIWPTVVFGALLLAAFLRLEAAIARRKGEPLIDPAILSHKPFAFGLAATSPLLNEVLAKARHAPAGAVSGVLITVQQISGAFGIALVGTAYFAAVNHYPAAADRAGFLVSMFAQLAMAGTAYLCLRQMESAGETNLSVVQQQMETGT